VTRSPTFTTNNKQIFGFFFPMVQRDMQGRASMPF
jgi:hypothetical protein